MPFSSCSALHGVNPNFFFFKKKQLFNIQKISIGSIIFFWQRSVFNLKFLSIFLQTMHKTIELGCFFSAYFNFCFTPPLRVHHVIMSQLCVKKKFHLASACFSCCSRQPSKKFFGIAYEQACKMRLLVALFFWYFCIIFQNCCFLWRNVFVSKKNKKLENI